MRTVWVEIQEKPLPHLSIQNSSDLILFVYFSYFACFPLFPSLPSLSLSCWKCRMCHVILKAGVGSSAANATSTMLSNAQETSELNHAHGPMSSSYLLAICWKTLY